MLFPYLVEETALEIRRQNPDCRIYVYTARPTIELVEFLEYAVIDGVTITLHDARDVSPFELFDKALTLDYSGASLRLNVFSGIEIYPDVLQNPWVVKRDITWIKDCPLPEDEVFMRYEL
jgi:hypothetical protein